MAVAQGARLPPHLEVIVGDPHTVSVAEALRRLVLFLLLDYSTTLLLDYSTATTILLLYY